LGVELPARVPSRQRSSSGIIFERLGNEGSVDEDPSSRRTDFISALSADAFQDRHLYRQIAALVRESSDAFREVHKNPFAARCMARGDERIPAARRALARVVNQAIRWIRSCGDRECCKTQKHDGHNAVGRIHSSSSVTKIRRISASREVLTTRRRRLSQRARARRPGVCFAVHLDACVYALLPGAARHTEVHRTV
jgi:hypothetical protein